MGKAKYSPCGAEQRSRASKASSSQQPAIDAALLLILVDVLRQLQAQHCASLAIGRAAHLVARFRALVEAEYRRHRSLSDMAAAVGVIPLTLRLCGRGLLPPATILRERIFREAQRLLLYATPTVAETAAHLGFEDAA